MTGFGGLLQLLRFIGAVVLFVLIGQKGWANNEKAQNLQLAVGSLIVGLGIGVVLYYWCLVQRDDRAVISFLVTPVASIIAAFILNHISKSIPSEKTADHTG
jgi:drug/metabolite transporter (DMT)-like permease